MDILDNLKIGRLEVVKRPRVGFTQQGIFSRLRDGVDYAASEIARREEEESSFEFNILNKENYRPLILKYKDYRAGNRYEDYYRIIGDRVRRWVELNESSVQKIKD